MPEILLCRRAGGTSPYPFNDPNIDARNNAHNGFHNTATLRLKRTPQFVANTPRTSQLQS
jgi:hypothetical protein